MEGSFGENECGLPSVGRWEMVEGMKMRRHVDRDERQKSKKSEKCASHGLAKKVVEGG